MWDGNLGKMSAAKHCIKADPPKAVSIYGPLYRCGSQKRIMDRKEVEQTSKACIGEPATTEWASSIVVVPLKNRRYRFCVDYRLFNALIARNCYRSPGGMRVLTRWGSAVFFNFEAQFLVLVDRNGRKDVNKTPFVSHLSELGYS